MLLLVSPGHSWLATFSWLLSAFFWGLPGFMLRLPCLTLLTDPVTPPGGTGGLPTGQLTPQDQGAGQPYHQVLHTIYQTVIPG